MPATTRRPVRSTPPPGAAFSTWTCPDGAAHVLHVSGELDITGRGSVVGACAALGRSQVVVDLTELTFLDSSGYDSLLAARSVLEYHGGSMRFAHARGQPLRLLSLFGQADRENVRDLLQARASTSLSDPDPWASDRAGTSRPTR